MLHVASTSDARFAPDCAVMLASLAACNPADQLTVHLLADRGLPAADRETLGALVTGAGGRFDLVEIDPDHTAGLTRSERFPGPIWHRVLLPELLPDLDRVIYLDADTMVTGPLRPLWDLDLNGRLVAAVTNPLLPSLVPRVRTLGLPDGASYFNSGVLLLDLAGWRREGVSAAVLEFAQSHHAVVWPDQDALNGVLHARRLALHPRWNALPGLWNVPARHLPYSPQEAREATEDPAVVHFVGPHKPWHYRNRHPYRAEYFTYLEQTRWRGRPIEGRSPWQAILRRLPWLWAYHVEVSLMRAQERLTAGSGRLRRRRSGTRR